MSGKELEKKSSIDYTLWNDSDGSERSSSDRVYSSYDYAILERLQFLTQRVQYLENKLDNSLSNRSDDLTFGLSVNNKNNIPNVDIKVLSGHRDEGEQILDGWEDSVVERNTSFLIIPVGEEQDLQADPNMIKQTLDLSLTPSVSPRRALGCPDMYKDDLINSNSPKETSHEEPTKINSISMQVRPPPVKTFAQPSAQSSSYLVDKMKESSLDMDNVSTERNTSHAEILKKDQELNTVTKNLSKLTTSSQKDFNNNDLQYGYTISVSRSPVNTSDRENNHLFNSRPPPDDKSDQTVKGNAVDFLNTFENNQHVSMLNDSSKRISNQPKEETICYQDVEICEVAQYEDKVDYENCDRTIDIKIERRISQENCVYLPTNRCESISKQYKNVNNLQNDDDAILEVQEKEVTNEESFQSENGSLYGAKKINIGDIRTEMQICDLKSQPWQKGHCLEIESDGPLIPPYNGTPKKRLTHNNSHSNTNHHNGMDFCPNNNTTIQKDPKHYTANKPTIKKVRVRSVEIPYTSSDDDILSVSSASELSAYRYQRPLRRKPKSKALKPQDIENQIRELIDPREIGNVRDQIHASHRPLLLSAMSPTESGYVGSSPNSPKDEWRSSSLTSVSTYERSPSYPDSPCSSTASYATPRRHEPARNLHYSVSSSVSDASNVFDNPDKGIDDRHTSLNIGNSRLNDVLPGPTRLSLSDYSPTQVRLSQFLSTLDDHSIASTASSVVTSDLSDSFLECQDECCQCQTGISTEDDFREELKSISRYVIEAGEKSGSKRKRTSLRKLFLDEEQGEMDTLGARLQMGENRAVPLLVKVILRLRKHFFGGLEGPNSLKSLTPRLNKQFSFPEEHAREKKISFSPSAMLLSAVGESSASEIRDVMEKDCLDVNELSPSGKSLLHKAAASGNLESIHTLIQYGAKVNLPDDDGFVPVHAALRRCHYKCAIFLIECGADMTSYTRTRMQEIADINNMARAYKKTVLNTAL